jgi:hypothetical protein
MMLAGNTDHAEEVGAHCRCCSVWAEAVGVLIEPDVFNRGEGVIVVMEGWRRWRVSGGKFFREGVYKGVGGGYSSASSLNAKPTTKTKSEVL